TRPSRGPWPCRIGTARPRAKLPGYACIIASTRRAASAAPNCANRRGRHCGAWLALPAANMCASSPFSSLLLLLLAAGCNDSPHTLATRAALDAPAVGVVDGLTKIRPDFAVPPSTTTSIEAARNEFEPFQIAVAGGASGVKGLTAVASELVGPAGARIPAADVRFFQEGLYHVNYASNVEGAAGDWPDPLIPDVDAYFGEKRNGLPFDVAVVVVAGRGGEAARAGVAGAGARCGRRSRPHARRAARRQPGRRLALPVRRDARRCGGDHREGAGRIGAPPSAAGRDAARAHVDGGQPEGHGRAGGADAGAGERALAGDRAPSTRRRRRARGRRAPACARGW